MSVRSRSLSKGDSRRVPLIVAALTLLLLAFGLTGATAVSGTTEVAITPLTPVKSVTTGVSVAAGKTYVFVASGGTTTVPTNALVVELAVTAKGLKAGTIIFAPLGEPGNASPTPVTWAPGVASAGTVRVNVGNSNKVVMTNLSTAAVTVGIKITGYATLVSAAGISGVGGSDGQVLTNQGNGTVRWETPDAGPDLLKAHIKANGQMSYGDGSSGLLGTGHYKLEIGRNIIGCAFTGSVGIIGSGTWSVGASIDFVIASTNRVEMFVRRGTDLTPVNSDFFVTAIC